MQLGISTDEWARMKPSRVKYIEHTWPLIDDLDMNREDCKDWLKSKGYSVPQKSACLGCPYHNDAEWRKIKIDSPDEFEEPCKVEDHLNDRENSKYWGDSTTKQYLLRCCKPLREVDFRTFEEMGQLNFFTDECEGMCGV